MTTTKNASGRKKPASTLPPEPRSGETVGNPSQENSGAHGSSDEGGRNGPNKTNGGTAKKSASRKKKGKAKAKGRSLIPKDFGEHAFRTQYREEFHDTGFDDEEVRDAFKGLPPGYYFIAGSGFWYEEFAKPSSRIDAPPPMSTFVCSAMLVRGRVRATDSTDWSRLIFWIDPDERHHNFPVHDARLHGDTGALCGDLSALGLKINTEPKGRQLFLRLLNQWDVKKRFTSVTSTGWHEVEDEVGRKQNVFVLPERTIGSADVTLNRIFPHAYRTKGTLEQWKANVATLAVGNTRMILMLSTALASTLVTPCGWEPGGFHSRGQSSTGKTTQLQATATVWGGPPREYLRSWRATANGLEGVAVAHNDALLILDEMAQVVPKEAADISYMLANGIGKSRANREGSARQAAQWRLLFLSSGEISLAEKTAEDGFVRRRATAGQQVRIVDVPSDVGGGGSFENLHGFETSLAFVNHLGAVSETYYGTAAPAFIEIIIGHYAEVTAEAKSLAKEICAGYLGGLKSPHGQVSRVAARFALVAAAGELGIKYGILPWPECTARDGVGQCFGAWYEGWGGPGAIELRAGVSQVRRFFELHGESRFQDHRGIDDHPVHNRAGFKKTDEGGKEWFVLREVWREEVCRGCDVPLLNKELIRLGILLPGTGRDTTKPVRIAALGPGLHRVFHISSKAIASEEEDD